MMINPTEEDIGRRVIYKDSKESIPGTGGIITGMDGDIVSVRFDNDNIVWMVFARDIEWE